ncbi:MAG: hypothetical protein S4CHLAM102_04960 [Chlamydiia bacterium]|nr:hypothetical protein [Chlamydiia bacterium]
MGKWKYYSYFALGVLVFVALNLSRKMGDGLRYRAASVAAGVTQMSASEALVDPERVEFERLKLENEALRQQIKYAKTWVLTEERIDEMTDRLELLLGSGLNRRELGEFLRRRSRDVVELLGRQFYSCQATVVFRDVTSWSSRLWVNRGSLDNEKLGREVIAVGSPVVNGASVVGVVEYVGKKQSRVRLITDENLTPSVRVVRSRNQSGAILEHINGIITYLGLQGGDESELMGALEGLRLDAVRELGASFLAKGWLHGSNEPMWRCRNYRLRGEGFNYDLGDDEGGARELRSGVLFSQEKKVNPEILIKKGDLLQTTGMDGIFPAGLNVALVSEVFPLKEGGYAYELEAIPTGGNLDELSYLQILPPLGFDPSEVDSELPKIRNESK